MDIPLLGKVTRKEFPNWLSSRPIQIAMFGGKKCRIVLKDYEDDDHKESFHLAIANFLKGTHDVLRKAEKHLFKYYKKNESYWLEEGNAPIKAMSDLWTHVQLGDEPMVTRRAYGDKGVYISIECSCEWEQEHGLQIVLKNGLKVNKLGPYDGHLTNSDAYDDEELEDVIFR